MDISRAKDILDYWFPSGGKGDYDKWFMKSKDYDAEIKEKFGSLLKLAEEGKGMGWLVSKESFVAYIILLDQFSRHIYRGSKDSYKNDFASLLFVKQGFQIYGPELEGYEFMFAFMPYMHTENLELQLEGKAIFDRYYKATQDIVYDHNSNLTNEEQEKLKQEWKMFQEMKPHAEGHLECIQTFGRFPKRNKVLGRESTEEEKEYMEQPAVKKRPY